MLGTKIKVKTLDGEEIITVDRGTQHGDKKTLVGKVRRYCFFNTSKIKPKGNPETKHGAPKRRPPRRIQGCYTIDLEFRSS